MSWDVIWQPGCMSEQGVATMADSIGDGRETGGHEDLIVPDELKPLIVDG